jgi:hypothetical protein
MERPWKAPSVAMILVRPVPRVILKAASFASVPEFVKNTLAPPGAPTIIVRRSARATCAGVAKKLDTWPRVAIWPVMADSTVGWACPRAVTARPDSRSRCLRPSASHT